MNIQAAKIYDSVTVKGRTYELRDLVESDISSIVAYWFDSDPAYLSGMGVDLNKISSREKMADAFAASLKSVRGAKDRITLIFSHENQPVGYTNVNYGSDGIGYGHLHIISPEYRNRGFVAQLFASGMRAFYQEFNVLEIRLQTNVDNRRITRYLDKMGFTVAETRYIDKPDGMARPGHYNLYLVDKARFTE